jgi:hypothetical protein
VRSVSEALFEHLQLTEAIDMEASVPYSASGLTLYCPPLRPLIALDGWWPQPREISSRCIEAPTMMGRRPPRLVGRSPRRCSVGSLEYSERSSSAQFIP